MEIFFLRVIVISKREISLPAGSGTVELGVSQHIFRSKQIERIKISEIYYE